ncbi:catabolite repressor/activator [Caviibacterium pharyngocola]|uniref:Catabolite repressor/activator n=1 Tax=Caviibacterium pharyngocola TaxID=28159 RepID=A0A2M8RW77_9PAST|nr:catabolite repressor/activator [Caviibacterium pharyngocola]PJG83123.1 catabolite repressor/activator [Caviibacterium pharyngocola]
MKLDEIAKLAGVSRTTVSYVVNGKAKQYRVSDKTIERVQALIEEHDFKPNAMAAGLRAGKSNTIGLIIPDFENVSYAKIANQLENRFRQCGYQLLIACTNDNPENEIECAKHLFRRQIDALIVSTALPADTPFYQESNVPVFGFDRRIISDDVINVLTDDEDDAYRLAMNLRKKKKGKSILFFGALPDLPISRERERGFRRAFSDDKKTEIDYLYASRFHKEEAAEIFEQWLTENPLPQRIFVTSLTLLQGVFQILLRQQKRIPKDLIIATFGDHEMLEVLGNEIVCAVQNHPKIVQSLLNLVINKLNNKKKATEQSPILRDIKFHHYR